MVDGQEDNHVVDQHGKPAWLLALDLLGGFRALVDRAHQLLAERGHPTARPAHGFALQAIGPGATAGELALRLGVTKQAAARTVASLETEGYVARRNDPHDARRRVVVRTARGEDLLAASALAFEDVVAEWRERVGADRIATLHDVLADLGVGGSAKLDLGSWSSTP